MNNEIRAMWSGLKQICKPEKDSYKRGIWLNKDGMRIDTPDYPNDLEACFRDFPPKLREVFKDCHSLPGHFSIQYDYYMEAVICCIFCMAGCHDYSGSGLTESQAFTNAVDKVIEEIKEEGR